MKRLLFLAAVAVATSGCVEADQSIQLVGHVFAEGTLDEETGIISGCEAPSPGAETIRAARLAIDLDEVENQNESNFSIMTFMISQLQDSQQLAPIGADYNLRTNQNAIQIERAVIEFPDDSNQSGFSSLDEEFAMSVTIDIDGSFFYGGIPLIRPTNLNKWKSVVSGATGGSDTAIAPGLVNVRMEGTTAAGNFVESNVLKMPFDICAGCGQGTTPTCVATK